MLSIGDTAPDFSGIDILTGNSFTLSDFEEHIVLITFNRITSCPPCQLTVPIVQKVWEAYKSKICTPPIQFVGISDKDQGNVVGALEAIGVSFPFLDDPSISEDYEIGSVPTLIVLRPGRKVCHIKVGLISSNVAILEWVLRFMMGFCGLQKCEDYYQPYFEAVAQILFGVTQDGGGVIIDGSGPVPIDPWDPLSPMSPEHWDILVGTAMSRLARQVSHPRLSKELEIKSLQVVEASIRKQISRVRRRPTEIENDRLNIRSKKTGKKKRNK